MYSANSKQTSVLSSKLSSKKLRSQLKLLLPDLTTDRIKLLVKSANLEYYPLRAQEALAEGDLVLAGQLIVIALALKHDAIATKG